MRDREAFVNLCWNYSLKEIKFLRPFKIFKVPFSSLSFSLLFFLQFVMSSIPKSGFYYLQYMPLIPRFPVNWKLDA